MRFRPFRPQEGVFLAGRASPAQNFLFRFAARKRKILLFPLNSVFSVPLWLIFPSPSSGDAEGEGVEARGEAGLQLLGAGDECRLGRRHIVDEEDGFVGDRVALFPTKLFRT
jgi:hypothetical protein